MRYMRDKLVMIVVFPTVNISLKPPTNHASYS